MSIKSMDAKELKGKFDKKEDFILVDCREQGEWDAGRIPGAIFLPMSEIENRFEELDKNKTIIVQCRSGKRSLNVCHFLNDNGYSDLTNLEGGILSWQEEGFEVEED